MEEGIEIMRQSALDAIAIADDLEHAAFMIKSITYFSTLEEEDNVD